MRAVVTGASRGLGRAIAEAYAAEGARLALTATRAEHLGSVCAAVAARGAECHAIALDQSDPASVRAAADAAIGSLGRIDVVIANAGVLGERLPLAEYPADGFAAVLDVNVTGVLILVQRLLPAMSQGGAVVLVTSGASGRPGWGAYGISKLALDGVGAVLREELRPAGIRVVAVNPGGVRTAMRAAAYPDENPQTLPHPSSVVEPFIAIAEGADPGARIEAREWAG